MGERSETIDLIEKMLVEVRLDQQLLREVLLELDQQIRTETADCPPLAGSVNEHRTSAEAICALVTTIGQVELTECWRWNRLVHLAEVSGLWELSRTFLAVSQRCIRRHGRILQIGARVTDKKQSA